MSWTQLFAWLAFVGMHAIAAATWAEDRGPLWRRHSIDDTARGADGVRLADANGDGRLDIVTGFEEAGIVRLYLNPGPKQARRPWPAVTVGRVSSPEDAVLVDLDGDGALDVVSCCEGKTRSVYVHWAPRELERLLEESAWRTQPFPALAGRMMAMYCLPLEIDGQCGIDLVIGGKGPGAEIGWLESPENPRDLTAWKWHPTANAGWIMSLVAADVDGDGEMDVLVSDRKGKDSGCVWLENPGPGELQRGAWKRHPIGARREEVMFLDYARLQSEQPGVLVPTYDKRLLWMERTQLAPPQWRESDLPYPEAIGRGKGVRIADVNLDGQRDIVVSTENYEGTSGLVWMSRAGDRWQTHEIS
jgi:hypothetical protein